MNDKNDTTPLSEPVEPSGEMGKIVSSKRNITEEEFDKLKSEIRAMHNPDLVPEINKEWQPLSESKYWEIKRILNDKGSGSFIERSKLLFSYLYNH